MVNERTPDWMVERIALGELPDAELRAQRQKLLSQADGQARLDALALNNEDILKRFSPAQTLAAIHEKASVPKASTSKYWLSLPLVAAMGLALVVFIAERPKGDSFEPLGESSERVKGAPTVLSLYRQQGAEVQRLPDGARVKAGDKIQWRLRLEPGEHVLLLSVDGRGEWTEHLGSRDEVFTVDQGRSYRAEFAFELDDAPHFESFYFLSGKPSNLLSAFKYLRTESVPDLMTAKSLEARFELSVQHHVLKKTEGNILKVPKTGPQ